MANTVDNDLTRPFDVDNTFTDRSAEGALPEHFWNVTSGYKLILPDKCAKRWAESMNWNFKKLNALVQTNATDVATALIASSWVSKWTGDATVVDINTYGAGRYMFLTKELPRRTFVCEYVVDYITTGTGASYKAAGADQMIFESTQINATGEFRFSESVLDYSTEPAGKPVGSSVNEHIIQAWKWE